MLVEETFIITILMIVYDILFRLKNKGKNNRGGVIYASILHDNSLMGFVGTMLFS